MRKKLFLHIGTHKTGTTTLQNFLMLNKQFLFPYEVRMDKEYLQRRPEIHRLADHAYDIFLASQDHTI